MSNSDDRPLHLGKFAPDFPSQTEGDDASDEGPTLMLRRIAGQVVVRELGPEAAASDDYGLPLKEMLGVITHCYARGIFCSKDIARLMRDEPQLSKAFGKSLPDETDIRRFRRRHAELIEDALENLYRAYPEGGPEPATPDTAEGTEILHKEAVERVHDAAWSDNTKGRLG